jgi:Ni,Fe-hydrogenase III large subunit
MSTQPIDSAVSPDLFSAAVANRVADGQRFCGLFASALGEATRLIAVLAEDGSLGTQETVVPAGAGSYPSLAARVPASAWYEREIRDLFGLEPAGHPRRDPLIFPFPAGAPRPRPGSGSGQSLDPSPPDLTPLPAHLGGDGVFTIPYGPVRSGVFEAIEYLVETPGEDIPHVRTRVFYKHRGVEMAFEGKDVQDGALLAERCEGVASVAHALAFCGAVERIGEVGIPTQAGLVRVLHAELERVANHLDSTIRHTDAAGQAVAYARFSLHKERVQRLRSQLCGSRFSRGVVVPGGVTGPPRLGAVELLGAIGKLEKDIRADIRLLLATPSFVDRLRTTGVLTSEVANDYGALGPVGRASGQMEDVRLARPYAAYGRLGHQLSEPRHEGDALARQRVRCDEIWGAFHLMRQTADELGELGEPPGGAWHTPVDLVSGEALGWAEAPQGEVLYLVHLDEGRLVRVKPRSASFHNLAFFPSAFPRDVLTDFAFIEASFGLSIAGVAS